MNATRRKTYCEQCGRPTYTSAARPRQCCGQCERGSLTAEIERLLAACCAVDDDLSRYAATHGPGPDRRLAELRDATREVSASLARPAAK